MTTDPKVDLAGIVARHFPYGRDPDVVRDDDDPKWCDCGEPWPCDTVRVLARLDAAIAYTDTLDALWMTKYDAMAEAQAAALRAAVERERVLREALEAVSVTVSADGSYIPHAPRHFEAIGKARAALATEEAPPDA